MHALVRRCYGTVDVTAANIIPSMRYRDAYTAINWLCDVLGFERRLVVPGDTEDTVAHAQLVLGNGMIMVGSFMEESPVDAVVAPVPDGTLTQSAFIVVSDIEGCYERVVAAEANITMELTHQDYGGSLFSVRDPEGQLWYIGSYNPWADAS